MIKTQLQTILHTVFVRKRIYARRPNESDIEKRKKKLHKQNL